MMSREQGSWREPGMRPAAIAAGRRQWLRLGRHNETEASQ